MAFCNIRLLPGIHQLFPFVAMATIMCKQIIYSIVTLAINYNMFPWLQNEVMKDFKKLRETVEEMGLFKTDPTFFAAHLGHILLLEVIGYLVLLHWGVGWWPVLVTSLILTTSQAQAGWTQHDYGHLSVFNNSRINHWMHYFVIGGLKVNGTSYGLPISFNIE